ncbi:MAG: DUF7518 family protein [Halodesulfurarchaeum sp.]
MTDGEDGDSARVEELTATIDGLTSELLDLQERVRLLESELQEDKDTETRSVEELFAQADGGTEEDNGQLADIETIGDDIIVG